MDGPRSGTVEIAEILRVPAVLICGSAMGDILKFDAFAHIADRAIALSRAGVEPGQFRAVERVRPLDPRRLSPIDTREPFPGDWTDRPRWQPGGTDPRGGSGVS